MAIKRQEVYCVLCPGAEAVKKYNLKTLDAVKQHVAIYLESMGVLRGFEESDKSLVVTACTALVRAKHIERDRALTGIEVNTCLPVSRYMIGKAEELRLCPFKPVDDADIPDISDVLT